MAQEFCVTAVDIPALSEEDGTTPIWHYSHEDESDQLLFFVEVKTSDKYVIQNILQYSVMIHLSIMPNIFFSLSS